MDMPKQRYIQGQIERITQSWTRISSLVGAIFFLSLGIMDYYVTPENFKRFMIYRLITALFLIAIYFLTYVAKSLKYQYLLIWIGVLLSTTAIELMILSFGGHRSPYFVGMTILIVAILGIVPLNLVTTIIVAATIYLIYVVPIVLVDTISDPVYFIMSNAFMLSTLAVASVGRYLSQRSLSNELALQYEIEEKKKHLEVYSLQLKSMVEERTKELSKSNQWHQALFDNATDGIVVQDHNGIIMNVNERACEMHGFSKEAMVGSHGGMLEVDEKRGEAADRLQRILQGESLVYETEHYKKDGTRIILEISSKAISIHDDVFIQSFQRDITEKKKVQEHLFQAQKMDSIGMLAGGIAHDFNNVLTAILGYTDLIRRDIGANEKVLSRLSVIENASRKAGTMVSQLLGFSRKSEADRVPFDINDIVHDTVRLLERVIDKRIVIRLALEDRLPPIEGDMNQIEQVLMNFMVNARDAMPYGGIITVSSSAIDAHPGVDGVPPYIPAGKYVVLSIADTGVGIPEEIQRKIFEPFFTTKERGKGTGLGLAMVYGVVTDHKGFVAVQSKINQGTTFTVYLPVTGKAKSIPRKLADMSARGSEMIMLVDDDESVLSFIKETLEKNGYKVIATTNPMSAIDAFTKMHREISLVITDVVMPLIDGKELMKRMAEIDPQARFLTVSGYSRFSDKSDDVKPDFFLQKPFDSVELLSLVRKIIDNRKATHER
jgi:PAS domain S-box-containing protein